MSYVKCMECRDNLKLITPRHLRKHGLTSGEYREKYPTVKLASLLWSKEHAKSARDRRFKRRCQDCGKPFTTGCSRAYYCPRCQTVRRVLGKRKLARRRYRLKRNSGCYERDKGTFNAEWYLEVFDGRVRGATLLERGVSINYARGETLSFNGSVVDEYEAICLTAYLIIWKGKLYCGECGSPIIVARENEHYTIPAEICCKSCGLVYDLDDLAETGDD